MLVLRIGIAGPLATQDISHLLEPGAVPVGHEMRGASLLVTLMEELLSRGHHVVAFTTEPALDPRRGNVLVRHGERFEAHFVPLRRSGFRHDRGRRGRMLDLFKLERDALVEAMQKAKPDLVHAHWTYEFAWAAIEAGLPHVVTCHDSPRAILGLMRDLYRLGRYIMARHVLRHAKYLTAVSPYLSNDLSTSRTGPIQVVPNPIPHRILQRGRCRTHDDFSERSIRIAMVINGWSKRKNAEVAMRALDKIVMARSRVEVDLVGPGFGEGEAAQQWARGAALQSAFKYHGWVPYRAAQDLVAAADLLVHPALEESFGMTVAEAMGLGVPVVAGVNSGAVPWVTGDGSGGVLVDVRSERAIADGVDCLLGSADVYSRFSENGRQRALAVFSPQAVVDAYMSVYQRALREPAGSGTPITVDAGTH